MGAFRRQSYQAVIETGFAAFLAQPAPSDLAVSGILCLALAAFLAQPAPSDLAVSGILCPALAASLAQPGPSDLAVSGIPYLFADGPLHYPEIEVQNYSLHDQSYLSRKRQAPMQGLLLLEAQQLRCLLL